VSGKHQPLCVTSVLQLLIGRVCCKKDEKTGSSRRHIVIVWVSNPWPLSGRETLRGQILSESGYVLPLYRNVGSLYQSERRKEIAQLMQAYDISLECSGILELRQYMHPRISEHPHRAFLPVKYFIPDHVIVSRN
jgi:hypothetical protein